MKTKLIIPSLLLTAVLSIAGSLNTASAQEDKMAMDKNMMMPDLKTWPEASQMAAKEMMDKYGKPNIAAEQMLVWISNGPWARTIVYKHEATHNFPVPHKDVMQQFISYKVSNLDKIDELAEFDGSVVFDRTQGEISARCDKEANNILALNLANDVATGKKSVKEAREFYGKTIAAAMKGEKPEYTQKLLFSSDMNAADADMMLEK
ncbi:MAG: hypothetical protein ABJA79_04570 [Parafilimonas sp.]